MGQVTLEGNVPDSKAYRAAYNAAANTSGVVNMVNHLR
ncbi:MAG: BON domain-containing protein [Desulfobacterales bacterium]